MRRLPRAVAALAVAAGLATALATGCGIPSDDVARRQDPADVPFDLLDDTPATSTTAASDATTPRNVCLVRDDGMLAATSRQVPIGTTLGELASALAEQPSAAERSVGLGTALADPADVVGVRTQAGVAIVDLAPAVTESGGRSGLEAIAQLVCTLTLQPGVGQVQFRVEGAPVEVARGDGTTTSEPVSRADYADLLATP